MSMFDHQSLPDLKGTTPGSCLQLPWHVCHILSLRTSGLRILRWRYPRQSILNITKHTAIE